MPELPEVETVRRGLAPFLEGAVIERVEQRRPDLRFPFPEDFAHRLTGKTIFKLDRRAKYLLADVGEEVLLMHLGMSGRFRIEQMASSDAPLSPGVFYHEQETAGTHDHVVLHLQSGARVIYTDPRRFGFMDVFAKQALGTHPHLAGLGIEPLDEAFTAEVVAGLFRGRRTPLKAALLDQRLIAGLGNIYVCEALYRAHLHPQSLAGSLAGPEGEPTPSAHHLVVAIKQVLLEAIEAGGSSLRDFSHANGDMGYFQHRFRVYDREGEPCLTPGCTGTISRIVQSGRSTFFCAVCQTQ